MSVVDILAAQVRELKAQLNAANAQVALLGGAPAQPPSGEGLSPLGGARQGRAESMESTASSSTQGERGFQSVQMLPSAREPGYFAKILSLSYFTSFCKPSVYFQISQIFTNFHNFPT